MEQLELRLLGRLDAPSIVPPHAIAACKTYRDAVKLCWHLRDGKKVRDLPGWAVHGFENACGNTAISQWHAAQAQLTVVEEMQLLRAAA